MIQIQFSNVTLSLGSRNIFTALQWEIQQNQKIGLIGPNGAGKSSLFKLITGEFHAEPGGSITQASGLKIGYLAQDPILDMNHTAFESALEGNRRYNELVVHLLQLEEDLGNPAVYNHPHKLTRVLEQQQLSLDEYIRLGGDSYPGHVQSVLASLGLDLSDQAKPIRLLSGGQKKLVGLARLMLDEPDVLLLDEPDNHLDLSAKQFLERFIQDYRGTVVIISHDRYLLDACVTHIAELEDGKLEMKQGDYSSYVLEKQQRLARQDELYQVQQHQIARIEAAIKRYSIWAKTYDNEKFAKRAKAIQNRLDKMDKMDRPILERRRMELRMHGWRGSSKVIEFKQVSKNFEDQVILQPADLLIRHGERVGVIGKNGTGKSVLLRLALEIEKPSMGEVIIGPSIRCAYYAQQHETLELNQRVLDVICLAGEMSEEKGVAYLRRYLFTYPQVQQKVKELSGGERSRLQLALVVMSGANFLILDEPTNNLDIQSAEVLEAALSDFEGTVLVVSHDRYFLDQVADRILVLDAGKVTSHSGGYSDIEAMMQNHQIK